MNAQYLIAMEMKQTRVVLLGLHLSEASVSTAGRDSHASERSKGKADK